MAPLELEAHVGGPIIFHHQRQSARRSVSDVCSRPFGRSKVWEIIFGYWVYLLPTR